MADINLKYGSNNQTITIILASLANGSKAVSNEINNLTNLFFDALLQLKIKTGASGVSSSGVIRVFAIGSADGGTSYPGSPNNELKPIGIFNANANATTFISNLVSVANAFNGKLPEKWKIVVKNDTGSALDATEGDHSKFYQGVFAQS